MLSERQETILQIVKENSPITGQHIANRLHVTRAALRSDLAILTMLGLIDARPKLGYFFTGNKEKDLLSRAITDITIDSCLSQPVIVGEHTSAYDAIIGRRGDRICRDGQYPGRRRIAKGFIENRYGQQ